MAGFSPKGAAGHVDAAAGLMLLEGEAIENDQETTWVWIKTSARD
jgi:hypothetical protein